jgi:exonuclease SbcC
MLPKLDDAEARIAELEADAKQVEALGEARRADALAVAAEATRRVIERQTGLARDHDALRAQLATAEAAVAGTHDLAVTLERIEQALAAGRTGLAVVVDRLARTSTERETIEQQFAVWQSKVEAHDQVDRRVWAVEAEWREWQLLAKALGRDGLPVLEIDAAGPTVSAYCNDLLASCFGPRFTVELVTQAAKADGKGTKEVFELRVLDNERGGDARDLNDLSGGEQILVDEALKNALALFINARQAGAIETIWRDETTGPLDPDNAVRYIEMLRRVQSIGQFHHVLFVSHNPAAAALADTQVRLADGVLTVHYAPFAEAA